VCSFRGVFGPSRLQVLRMLCTDCKLSIAELLKLLSHGFEHNFQPLRKREELLDQTWQQNERILTPLGFKYLFKKTWFPRSIDDTLMSFVPK